MLSSWVLVAPGSRNHFLGLEDYQRALILGGLAVALLSQQTQGGATGEPIPDAETYGVFFCYDGSPISEGCTLACADDPQADRGSKECSTQCSIGHEPVR